MALNRGLLFEYISSELFAHLPASRQNFLLALSPLPHLTADMARALTGESTSSAILEDLRRTQGLILARNNNATVYAFHPLFSDFLRVRAERAFPAERLRVLRIRAAGLLAERGEIEAATNLYQTAETGLWPVRIRTLGRFEVIIDGVSLQSSGKSQRKLLELLKALVAFGGEQVNIDKLSDALWPDAEGGLARSAFA